MITVNKEFAHQKLFDGSDPDILKIKGEDGNCTLVPISQLNYFGGLSKGLQSSDLQLISQQLSNFRQSTFFEDAFTATDSLPLMYYQELSNNRYFLISFGEFQPARYKAYLELVFTLQKSI